MGNISYYSTIYYWKTYDYDAPSNASRDEEEEDEDEPKNCFKIAQNRVCCSLGYIIRYIGTTNARKKVLWVYSHLKSEFFSDNIGQKLT